MMVDLGGRRLGLQVTLVLLAATLRGVDLIEQIGDSQQPQNASLQAQNSLVAAAATSSSSTSSRQPPVQQQAQQARMQQQPRSQASRSDNQQMQLGGKCASKGSCSRELASRRLDLDSGPDKQACHCDQLCASYDDCCRDSRWAEPLANRYKLGVEKLQKRRQEWQCKRVNPIYTSDVLLRASCHPDWLAKQTDKTGAQVTRQRCEMLEPSVTMQLSDPMGSLMPITDLTSGITYANSYCLRCNPPQVNNSTSANNSETNRKQKLIYWSPRVTCNYNLDLDDRNTLYDLISSKKGQALRYSRRRNRWLIRMPNTQSATSSSTTRTPALNATTRSHSNLEDSVHSDEIDQNERICAIHATIPDSMEHLIRHCRARMIDWCPASAVNATDTELQQAIRECHFGHQSLVYSQTSDSIYFNLACAKCHRERQVFCEPRLKKQLDTGPVSRITSMPPNGSRVLSAPVDPFGYAVTNGAGEPDNQLDDIPKSRNGGEGSFSVLMDLYGGLQGDNSNEQVGAVHRCEDAERQVYDPFLLTCRDIVCGLNHRFVDGACVQVDESAGPSNLANLNFTAETLDDASASVPQPPPPPPLPQDKHQATANSSSVSQVAAQLVGSQVQVAGTGELERQEVPAKGERGRGRESSTQPAAGNEDKRAMGSSGPVAAHGEAAQTDKQSQAGSESSAAASSALNDGARLVVGSSGNSIGQLGHDHSSGRSDELASKGPRSDNNNANDDNNSFVELLASLQLRLDELPQPTSESRRAFAECAKILIQPEHYRLFTVADLESSSVTPTGSQNASELVSAARRRAIESESSARLPPPPPDAKFLSVGEHDQRRDSRTPSSWEQRQNIWALVAPYNLTLASSQFELVRGIAPTPATAAASERQSSGRGQLKLLVCSPFKSDLVAKFKPTMVYLTTCCLAVSIASLVCFLILYGLSTFDLRHLVVELTQAGQMNDSLRTDALDSKFRGSRASQDTSYNATRSQNLSSRGVACLATALLAAYLLFILGHQQQQEQPATTTTTTSVPGMPSGLTSCTIIAAATFCSFLMAFNWMFLLSYDIWRTLRLATCQLRAPTMSSQSRRFIVYALCAAGVALGITALALVVDQYEPSSGCTAGAAALRANIQQQPPATTCSPQQTELERLLQIYKPKFGRRAGSCWFSNRRSLALFFGLPVTLIMFINLLFFLHSSFMVIKTSSRSSRRPVTQTSSNCSTNSQVSTVTTQTNADNNNNNQQQHQYLCELDFAQQNGMTTSSLASVQTIQSNLSLRSESEFGSGDESTTTTTTTTSGSESPTSRAATECQRAIAAAAQIQIQIEQIDSTSRQLDEGVRLSAAATRRRSFGCAKQASSSSLLSGASSRSLAGNSYSSSLATNLAQKYDAHLNNLSAFMSSIVKDYRLYCRLSTIMGLTWLTGLMASVVDQSDLLWYLFVVLNTLQGLFIFVAFGFKRSRLTNVEILVNYLRFKLAAAREGGRSRTNSETGGLGEKATTACERPTAHGKGGDF